MPPTTKLAEYLFQRLCQLGIGSIHGVPGDYNLKLLDYVVPAGLTWVGNANELNAGYAADGYARIKGIGALITTFGVGELSALNAIAGAYAERAAVVHIVGTPERATQDERRLVHHTFNDGEYRRFAQMSAHVTVAQASLRDPRLAPEQIDTVLRACLLHSRPVYIEVPVDLVDAPVATERLDSEIQLLDPNDALVNPSSDKAIGEIMDKIYAAKQPIILVDGETRPMRVIEQVQKLVNLTQWPTWTTSYAKGLLDESQPNFHGMHEGKFGSVAVKEFIDNADLVLNFGPHYSATNSYMFSARPAANITISFKDTKINIQGQVHRDMPAQQTLNSLLSRLDASKANPYSQYPSYLPRDTALSFTTDIKSPSSTLTQSHLWGLTANFLHPGDIIMGETGTAGYGVRAMPLPAHARVFAPVTWLSIGYMLPAAQGAALAQRELLQKSQYHGLSSGRTLLFIGDGSLQMTIQELSTMIRLGLDVVVVVLNNDGYTIERCLHGLKQAYNDIPGWRYLLAPALFGAKEEDTFTAQVRTWADLEKVMGGKEVMEGKGLRMIEVFLGREDVPEGMLKALIEKQQELEREKVKQNGVQK